MMGPGKAVAGGGDYPRLQFRGPIADTWYGPGEPAKCSCPHGNTWPEGGGVEDGMCIECVEAWREERAAA
jgi:hypothetical protein